MDKLAGLAANPFPFVRDQETPERAAASSEESSAMASAPAPGGVVGIAKRWRELHGEHSWNGLLDPLDIDLRQSIINYGEFAQATYDGFNTEQRSPHCGACIYGADELLHVSTVSNAKYYKVTKFVYSTSTLPLPAAFLLLPLAALKDVWSRESNWMGYVAVATDEGAAALGRRDIVVAWRGTIRPLEWTKDLDVTPAPAGPVLGSSLASKHPLAMVHHGFLSLYTSSNAESKFNKTSAREQVVEEVKRLMELYKDEETSITVTGHSLGAAMATLNAVDMAANGVNAPANSTKPPCPVTAIVFACPHVGNVFFKTACRSVRTEHNLRSLHIRNLGDVVPLVPAVSYMDVHVALPINTGRSPHLNTLNPRQLHNLELYLHGLAGEQGSRGGFKMEVDRDIALANKDDDLLKDEYPVPGKWWALQHKGMVKNDQGKWELRDFKHV
ncbi:hypothetical protein QOZ80_5AG0407800 [Eleusine coracana subsp. coracana]|nr:hypothetical protein QOZ80_5AG0407800 [Eleusine coracana subsp. coracana]